MQILLSIQYFRLQMIHAFHKTTEEYTFLVLFNSSNKSNSTETITDFYILLCTKSSVFRKLLTETDIAYKSPPIFCFAFIEAFGNIHLQYMLQILENNTVLDGIISMSRIYMQKIMQR